MPLDVLHKIVYALISGFSEMFFVSVPAHQFVYRSMSGNCDRDPVLNLVIHLGCIFALLFHCWKYLKHLRYEKRLQRPARRKRVRTADPGAIMDMRIINTGAIAAGIGVVLFNSAEKWISSPALLGLLIILNGIVIFLPRLLPLGNKDGLSFSLLDGLLVGIAAVAGMFPGFSMLGCMYSMAILRGGSKSYVLNICLAVSIPILIITSVCDVYLIAVSGLTLTFLGVLSYLLAMFASFIGAYICISLVRFILSRTHTGFFAYYNWGLAIFVLLIALLTP